MSAVVYTCIAGAVGAFFSEVRKAAEMNRRVDPWMAAQAMCENKKKEEVNEVKKRKF